MGKIRCLVCREALIVAFLGYSVLVVDTSRVLNNIQVTSRFGLQVIPLGSLGVSGPCILKLSCVTWSKLA